MSEATARVLGFVRQAVDGAQQRFAIVQREVLKAVQTVQKSFKEGQVEGAKRWEELVGSWTPEELLEKLKADEVLAHGVALRKELADRLGVVLHKDFTALQAQVETLRKDVGALKSTVTGKGRNSIAAMQKQVRDLKAEVGRLKDRKATPKAEG